MNQKTTSRIAFRILLIVFFSIYAILHHILGVYEVRWFLYLALAVAFLWQWRTKQDHVTEHTDPIFAQGLCLSKVFMMFVIGCMIGTYYEEIMNFVRSGNWESRQGIIYGPLNPIYGAGFAAFTYFLGKGVTKHKWYVTYLYACLLGGITEYSLSWIGEVLFHANSWDYSGYFLNIGGRTTVPFMLFWGLGGLFFIKVIYPLLSKIIEAIPYKLGKAVFPVLVAFVILDMVVSYSALIRQAQRQAGNPPITIVGQLYDQVYTDDFLKDYYANMVHETIRHE